MTLQSHSLGIEDALLRYQHRRADRVKDLVLKARKRCDVTHAKDPAVTAEPVYDNVEKIIKEKGLK